VYVLEVYERSDESLPRAVVLSPDGTLGGALLSPAVRTWLKTADVVASTLAGPIPARRARPLAAIRRRQIGELRPGWIVGGKGAGWRAGARAVVLIPEGKPGRRSPDAALGPFPTLAAAARAIGVSGPTMTVALAVGWACRGYRVCDADCADWVDFAGFGDSAECAD